MPRNIVGLRIRERRRQVGITQADLARRMEISPSYLNLIERNKRGIAGPLLVKAATALDLSIEDLDGAAERRLVETLHEIAHLPALRNLDIEAESAAELIGRYPGWARALSALVRSEREASASARALADRLTHDPFLGETVHRMLTRTSAIRSAAEIVTEYPDVSAEERSRFDAIILQEVRVLSEIGEALAAYFDRVEDSDRTLTPLDEVEALFDAHDNHFAIIEEAAGHLDAEPDGASAHERYANALALAERDLAAPIQNLVETHATVETEAARTRAVGVLMDYATLAILAPLDTFEARAEAAQYDCDVVARGLEMTFDMVARRLTALPTRPDKPTFGYMRANAAGTLIEMRSLPGLAVPRYSAACPLWVLYTAQQTPETVVRQRTVFPSGLRFVFVARARNTGEAGFGRSRHFVTDMVTMSEESAGRTVYLGESDSPAVDEVGPACRLCPRQACSQRVDDPLTG